MSQRRRRSPARSSAPRVLKPEDMWRPVPDLAPPEPITPIDDTTALVRSLGDPPLPGHHSTAAGHYLATVVERAAVLATALAASADLLVETEGDDG